MRTLFVIKTLLGYFCIVTVTVSHVSINIHGDNRVGNPWAHLLRFGTVLRVKLAEHSARFFDNGRDTLDNGALPDTSAVMGPPVRMINVPRFHYVSPLIYLYHYDGRALRSR